MTTLRASNESAIAGPKGRSPDRGRAGGDTSSREVVQLQRALGNRGVQALAQGGQDASILSVAGAGLSGAPRALPYLDKVQAAFGRHDVRGVRAFVGGDAASANQALGASAYAMGAAVAFRSAPDLHTAAHEAAHVVQQRSGVSFKGVLGEEGGADERHADAVADAVVAGRSAEALLDARPRSQGGGGAVVQRKATHEPSIIVQDLPNSALTVGSILEDELLAGGSALRVLEDAPRDGGPFVLPYTRAPISGTHGPFLVFAGRGGSIDWFIPLRDLAPGAYRRGAYWIWWNGHELQRAVRRSTDHDKVLDEIHLQRNLPFSESVPVRDVERQSEAAAELNASVEAFLSRGASLEQALAETKKVQHEVLKISLLGYFQAFQSFAGFHGGGKQQIMEVGALFGTGAYRASNSPAPASPGLFRRIGGRLSGLFGRRGAGAGARPPVGNKPPATNAPPEAHAAPPPAPVKTSAPPPSAHPIDAEVEVIRASGADVLSLMEGAKRIPAGDVPTTRQTKMLQSSYEVKGELARLTSALERAKTDPSALRDASRHASRLRNNAEFQDAMHKRAALRLNTLLDRIHARAEPAPLPARSPVPTPPPAQPRKGRQHSLSVAEAEHRLAEKKRVDDPRVIEESRLNDQAFSKRKEENAALHQDRSRVEQDLEKAGMKPHQYEQMMHGNGGSRVPLGFKSEEQFHQFQREFGEVVSSIHVEGKPISAVGRIIGTSTSFYSGNPKKDLGHHFDRKGVGTGDFDIELSSPELTRMMLRSPTVPVNQKVIIGGQKTLFKSSDPGGFYEVFPEFQKFAAKWQRVLGRDVDVKLTLRLDPVKTIPKTEKGPAPIEIWRTP